MTSAAADATLSVVIPVHDSEQTIRDTVRSVLEQDVPGVEVIVVDDGSATDPATVLGDHLASGAVRLIRQENLGASVARNVGLAAASSALVMFVDGDDRLVPDSLGPFVEAAQRSSADVTLADFYLKSNGAEILVNAVNTRRTDFDRRDSEVLQWLTLARVGFDGKKNVGLLGAPWAKIYRRAFLYDELGRETVFVPGILRGQDVLLNTEVFGKVRTVHYWQAPCYVYSVTATSASHRVAADFVERATSLSNALEDLIRRNGWSGLRPAVAKTTVTLLDEALQRDRAGLNRKGVRRLLRREPFVTALRRARLRDFSAAGKVKVLAFRSGASTTFILLKAFTRVIR